MRPGHRHLLLVAGVILAVGLGAVLIVSTSPGRSPRDQVARRIISVEVADFARRLEDPDTFAVNVHVPYEGEIEGTDAFIPFDQIAGDDRLPSDQATEILLYCRSGSMSAIAARGLNDAGYTNIVDLDGGMVAWEAAGLPILQRPSD